MTKEHVNTNHTFAICAYKESPYLEECITSLMEQTVKSEIFIATSTPNKYIDNIAAKYNLKVYVNEGESGITQDWNFAYSKVQTDYVTIAHQDDKYAPEYVENLLAYTAKAKKPLLFFTDYAEIRNGKIVTTNKILKVKRIMLFIMRPKAMWGSRFIRRRVLSLGSPICCPSATYYRPNLRSRYSLMDSELMKTGKHGRDYQSLRETLYSVIRYSHITEYMRTQRQLRFLMIIRDLKKITLCTRSSGPNVLLKCLLRHTARVKNLMI